MKTTTMMKPRDATLNARIPGELRALVDKMCTEKEWSVGDVTVFALECAFGIRPLEMRPPEKKKRR